MVDTRRVECSECGTALDYTRNVRPRVTCSPECGALRHARLAREKRGAPDLTQFVCKICGAACIEQPRKGYRRWYCDDCKKQVREMYDDTKRARRFGAFIAPVNRRRIFERDKWRCQICLEQVSRSANWPDPRSATIDHIIPLSKGGTHEPSNCQLAHAGCNSSKGAGAADDRLRLIG